MPAALIDWHVTPVPIDADPGAVVALDRAAWEAHGARFAERDDGQGESPGLATATLIVAGAETVDIGVLDYGADETYLLVPAHVPAERVLRALESGGVLPPGRDLATASTDQLLPTVERDALATISRVEAIVRLEAQRINLEAFGLAVREYRRERGLTQEALAGLTGMHRTYLGGIERGQRNVSYPNINRLAEALDVSLADLATSAELHKFASRDPGGDVQPP